MSRLPDRIVVDESGCMVWLGACNDKGYGQFHLDGKTQYVHRVAYEDAHGDIPAGYVIDHLCRNTRCVNPSHLEAVTNGENIRRGWQVKRPTHCLRGHDLSIHGSVRPQGGRDCRLCAVVRRQIASEEQKERRRAYAREWQRAKRLRVRESEGRTTVRVLEGDQ